MSNLTVIHWALVNKVTGEIVKMGGTRDVESILEREDGNHEAFMDRPKGLTNGQYYFDYANNQWIERPTLPEPAASYDLAALPAGTIVTVIDESSTVYEITDLSETLILEGPQTYRVKVDPPFPYQRIVTELEIS